jgi:hypothetical protein
MSGRGLSADDLVEAREQGSKKGLYTRLNSHASGRRSGDQFCDVCDRLVLKVLTSAQIHQVYNGKESLDRLTREYIHSYLSYRFIKTLDGQEAARIGARGREGALDVGQPLLNPDRSA